MGGRGADRIAQYLRNTSIRETEEDYFAPQVVNQAIGWLDEHHDLNPFFLYVDIFDPHEPWDAPAHYVERYDPTPSGDDVIYPAFGGAHNYEAGDLQRMRALYAAEVTMVDHWVGKLLQRLDDLGHREDTVVAFMSDHGIFLGEHGLVGKMGGKSAGLMGWPTYTELSHVPMMFRVPGAAPGRRTAFVHPGDVGPTLLETSGVPVPPSMRTSSLRGVITGEQERVRDLAVSSWSLRGWSAYRPSVVRSEEWTLVFWRTGIEPELFHRPTDPGETRNVYQSNRAAARELHTGYLEFLRQHETPLGGYLPRLWMMSWGGANRQSLLMPDKKS
jgi:arylsulfatase A-like enzyme